MSDDTVFSMGAVGLPSKHTLDQVELDRTNAEIAKERKVAAKRSAQEKLDTDTRPPKQGQFFGMDYRANGIPNIKEGDSVQPEFKGNAKIAVLDLSDPEDLVKYEGIWEKLAAKEAVLGSEDKQYDEDIKSWRVLIRYSEVWFQMPETKEKK
jgi:hypothetical protein